MKTQEQILERMNDKEHQDLFGTQHSDLLTYLNFENAQQFLKDGVTEEQFDKAKKDDPVAEIKDYMSFALDKCTGHRGLSAGRSVNHMQAWLWLDDKYDEVDWDDYTNYGAPILKDVCDLYEIDYKAILGSDYYSEMFERMASGRMCCDDCDEGCG